MKMFSQFPIFFLIISVSSLDAQVLAGVTGDLTYTAATINQSMATNPLYTFEEFRDSLDLDGDSQHDIIFISTISNIIDFEGSTIGIQTLNPTLEVIYDSSYVSNLTIGTPIVPDSSWSVSDFGNIAFDFIGIGGLTTGGNWYPTSEGYLGFRMDSGGETRYGWIHLFAAVSQESFSLIVYGSAIESIVNGLSQVETVPNLTVFPNPASGKHLSILSDRNDIQSICLFTLSGNKLLSRTDLDKGQIELKDIPAGTYLLRVTFNNGLSAVETFVRI